MLWLLALAPAPVLLVLVLRLLAPVLLHARLGVSI